MQLNLIESVMKENIADIEMWFSLSQAMNQHVFVIIE